MAWFQRYGIPGTYFWGLSILWVFVLFPCQLNSLNIKTLQIIVGIAGATFLPVGYLISILQQIIYLWPKKPWLGITGRAIKKSKLFIDTHEREYLLEAEACLFVMSKKRQFVGTPPPDYREEINVESQRFFQDWIRNRNNVIAINLSLIVATVLAVLSVLLVPKFCLEWQYQPSGLWLVLFAIFVSIFVLVISYCSWRILRREIIRVEAGIYKIVTGQCGTKLIMRGKSSSEAEHKKQ